MNNLIGHRLENICSIWNQKKKRLPLTINKEQQQVSKIKAKKIHQKKMVKLHEQEFQRKER